MENVVLKDELVLGEENWKKFVEGAITLLTSPLSVKKRAVTRRKSPNVLYLIGELSCRIETFDLESGSCTPASDMAQTAVAMPYCKLQTIFFMLEFMVLM